MATNEELSVFVRDSLSKGLPREQIEQALIDAGWPADQAKGALKAYAEVLFPVPVPRPRAYVSAWEAFLYLVLFTTLYTCAFHFGDLLFTFINQAFPDAAQPQYAYLSSNSGASIRRSVAALIVAFPVFLFTSWKVQQGIRQDSARRASKVRKWLTNLTLFLTASILVGDLIALVYNLLGGELHTRFVLKVLTVGLISGSIFVYYLWDLRSDDKEVEK